MLAGGDPNQYAYAFGDPINFRDSNGRFPVALAVAIPIINGIISGIANELMLLENNPCATAADFYKAFGRGFVSGAAGSAVSMGLAAAGLPAPAAAAIGAMISTAVESAMQGQTSTLQSELDSGVTSAILTALTGGLIPMKGASPALTTARNQLGINSNEDVGSGGPRWCLRRPDRCC